MFEGGNQWPPVRRYCELDPFSKPMLDMVGHFLVDLGQIAYLGAVVAHLIRSGIFTAYPDVARECGLVPNRLLRSVGLGAAVLVDPDNQLPLTNAMRLLELSAMESGAEDFGLRLAERHQLSHLGPIGLVIREEPTLGSVLRALERHFRLFSEAVLFRLELTSEVITVHAGVIGSEGRAGRQATELVIGILYRTLRNLLGNRWTPAHICFSHPAPRGQTSHRRIFRRSYDFGCDFNGIVCDAKDLNTRIASADPIMARYVRDYVESLRGGPEVLTSDRVRKIVFALLPTGRCTGEAVAQLMNLDRRTVNRQLMREGETYWTIVNSVRLDLAKRHIATERRSFSDTADLLGFSGLSSFSRWFRSEFGCAASTWKDANVEVPTNPPQKLVPQTRRTAHF